MSLSKSKCYIFAYNCLHFLKCTVPLGASNVAFDKLYVEKSVFVKNFLMIICSLKKYISQFQFNCEFSEFTITR
jgi:hypothetical protein